MMTFRYDPCVVLLTAVLTWQALPVCLGADTSGDIRCLWHEPRETRAIETPVWEQQSSSPFGGSRLGGADRRSYAISPDGNLLATQDAGGWQLEHFDLRTGKSLARFGKIEDPVATAFAPDGKTLVTASWNEHGGRSVELWEVARRERVRSLDEGVNFTPFPSIAFSPDGKMLALATRSRGDSNVAVHIWDAASGEELGRLGEMPRPAGPPARAALRRSTTRASAEPFGAIAFAPDGRSLAVVADDRVTLLEVASGRERAVVGRLPPRTPSSPRALDTPARVVVWLNYPRLLAVGCDDGLIRLYDVSADRRLPPLSGHGASVVALRVLPDGKTLISFGLDNRACTWNLGEALRARLPDPQELPAEAGEELFRALGGQDRLAAHRAGLTLANAANVAALLARKVAAVPQVDKARAARLAEAIGSEDYNERRRAAAELRELGELALPVLRRASTSGRNEMLSDFLGRLQSQPASAERGMGLQAIDVLAESPHEASRRMLAELAKGAEESAITQRAARALALAEQIQALPSATAAWEDLWTELAGDDPARAWLAMRALAAQPAAIEFLRDRVEQAVRLLAEESDPARVQQQIAELDSDEFAGREAASANLRELGASIHPALREALSRADSPEVRSRIESILKNPAVSGPSKLRLQAERGAESLAMAEFVARR